MLHRMQHAVARIVYPDKRQVDVVGSVYPAQQRQDIVADKLVVHVLAERQCSGGLDVYEHAVNDDIRIGPSHHVRRVAKVGVEVAFPGRHGKPPICHLENAPQVAHVGGIGVDKVVHRARPKDRIKLGQIQS